MDPYGAEDAVNLGRERIAQTRKNYINLQKQSYEIPLNREKATIPKWLVQKLKAEGKSLEPRVYQMNKTAPRIMKQTVDDYNSKNAIQGIRKKEKPTIDKVFDQRHIFIIADGQSILAEDLKFTYVEINERLSKFVPEKVWQSNAAQRLTLNQKIELSMPSMAMQEQCMLEIIDEACTKIGEQFETAYLIDGEKMRSPLEIPIQSRIIVVSKSDSFQGIEGLEHFEGYTRSNVGGVTFVNHAPSVRVKPQPQTWVHMAQVKWTRQNGASNIPSYSDGGPNDSETQNKIIEAI